MRVRGPSTGICEKRSKFRGPSRRSWRMALPKLRLFRVTPHYNRQIPKLLNYWRSYLQHELLMDIVKPRPLNSVVSPALWDNSLTILAPIITELFDTASTHRTQIGKSYEAPCAPATIGMQATTRNVASSRSIPGSFGGTIRKRRKAGNIQTRNPIWLSRESCLFKVIFVLRLRKIYFGKCYST